MPTCRIWSSDRSEDICTLIQNSLLTEFQSLQLIFFSSRKIFPTSLSAGPETKDAQILVLFLPPMVSRKCLRASWFCHKVMSVGKGSHRYWLVKIHRCFATGKLLVVARHGVHIFSRRQLNTRTFRLSSKSGLIFPGVQRTLSFCSLQQEIRLLNTTGNQSNI